MASGISVLDPGELPAYARSQAVAATVALFVANAAAFTAFAYAPAVGEWRLLPSFAVIPYALFVAWTTYAHRDFLGNGQAIRHIVLAGLVYGGVAATLSFVNGAETPWRDLTQGLGLLAAIVSLGGLLPLLLRRDDYLRIAIGTVRCMAPLALIGIGVEIFGWSHIATVPMLYPGMRGDEHAGAALFLHHTVVAHDFQWLPWLGWVSLRARGWRRAWLDVLAAGICGAFVISSGSRQGAAFMALILAALLWFRPRRARNLAQLAPALAAVAVLALAVSGWAPKAASGFVSQGAKLTGRLTLWHETLLRLSDGERIFSGYGIAPKMINGWLPHNSPLSQLAAFGVGGFAAFLLLMGVAIRAATRHLNDIDAVQLVVLASVFGLFAEMGVEDFALRPYSGAYLALWFMMGQLVRSQNQHWRESPSDGV